MRHSSTREKKQKKAYEEAKELDGAKSSVLSVVSHEFRTPITIAKGAIELAMGEPNPDERKELLIRGRDALVRLNKLVGGLIAFAKMERVRLRMEKVDISGVIDYAAKEASPMAEGRQVVIETEVKGSPVVEGDEDALNKVVYALLDNAVKFNKRGGVVKVAAVSSDNMVRLRVEDTGMGISREELGKIFQPLYQVDASTTRKYPGIGMGLAIVFNLVRAHGGRILAESDPGRGSRFTLLLPANRQKSLTPSH